MSRIALHAPLTGWLAPLSEVPDPVFAEKMMGEGLAIDPTEGVVRAPADATVLTIPDTRHAVSLELANGAQILIHIGIDTVKLGGEGFRALVSAGQAVRQGDPLIEFDLDAVVRKARDPITPMIIASDAATVELAPAGREIGPQDVVCWVEMTTEQGENTTNPRQITTQIAVLAPSGIHARPAARIVALLKPYDAALDFTLRGRSADARSAIQMLALGARHGDTLTAQASGPDAQAALDALTAFAAERFGDDAGAPPVPPPAPTGKPIRAAPGLAIGTAFQLRSADPEVIEKGSGIAAERAALEAALASVDNAIRGERSADIGEAHRALLADPALLADADQHIAAGRSAAFAWRSALRTAAAAIEATGDALLIERIADLRDVERRVIAALTGAPAFIAPVLPRNAIILADDLLPSEFNALNHAHIAGIVTAHGGPTSHVAILAAAAGVPMIVAAGADVLGIADTTPLILDADTATLTIDPDDTTLAATASRAATQREARAAAVARAHEDTVTADGVRVEIFANLGSAADAAAAVAAGAEGCGLLRTEFLFLDRATAPDEAEQRAVYSQIATTLGTRPLIVRTLDIGGDKPVAYLPPLAEENPALGLRGIRLGLARPDMLDTQLRAILKSVPGGQCRIMLPMIVDVLELRTVRAHLDAAMSAVGRTDPVQLGVMIETPAAAMLADQLAAEADFLSIGTNDLTQYGLAVDRTNSAVSAKIDALHPAILRLIAQTAAGAKQHGKLLGVCGGLAADPRAAALLIGMGVRELSVPAGAIPELKAQVRTLDTTRCVALAERALAATSPQEVHAILGDRS